MKIILASASPRRRELLQQIGLEFEVRVSNTDEQVKAYTPGKIVEKIAQQKAHAVFDELQVEEIRNNLAHGKRMPREDYLIIAADTVVALGDEILGKPTTPSHAGAMIHELSGKTHQVYTGVALIYYPGYQEPAEENSGAEEKTTESSLDDTIDKMSKRKPTGIECKSFHERTDVTFYDIEHEEMDEYVATGDCMDKAGAYGIQGFFARYVKGIQGDYNNVVGLPVGRLYQEIKEWLV